MRYDDDDHGSHDASSADAYDDAYDDDDDDDDDDVSGC